MFRPLLAVSLLLALAAPAAAQTQQEGQMALYIQQLEARVRELTGQNQELAHQVDVLRAQLGEPAQGPAQTGALSPQGAPDAMAAAPMQQEQYGGQAQYGAQPEYGGQPQPNLGAPPRDLGTLDVPGAQPEPGQGAPVDLSTLAAGNALGYPQPAPDEGQQGGQQGGMQTAMAPRAPAATTALSGSPRDEYDLAYGYILTGDYGLAEESFKTWLASFPNDPQASDAEFWLGESYLQQREYRDAANAFLAVYKTAPDGPKGPDALLKLGVSLSALGEKAAACATFSELGKRYPRAAESVVSRVHDEAKRAGCG
jgi:tol-pal system protein YbgF